MPIDGCSSHNSPSADEGENLFIKKGPKKTVEGLRKINEADAAQAQLDLIIKDALELRQLMMLKKTNPEVNFALKDKIDSELEAELREREDSISSLVMTYKKLKLLPHDWEYDPETVSTFLSTQPNILKFRTTTRRERGALLQNKISRLRGMNYTQLRSMFYKIESDSKSDNNPDVKNLLKDNDKELMKDLEDMVQREVMKAKAMKVICRINTYMKGDILEISDENNSPSADEGEKLVSIKGSNKTVESPSVGLGKRKRTRSYSEELEPPEKKICDTFYEIRQRSPVITRSYTRRQAALQKRKKTDEGDVGCRINTYMKDDILEISDENNSPSTDEGEKLDSIKGSNKTVESPSGVLGRRTRRTDRDATSTRIPLGLDLLMQTASEIRRSMMQTKLRLSVAEDRKDLESELDSYRAQLDECEYRIGAVAEIFKKLEELPHDWEYVVDTASTFVSAEADISTLPKMPPPKEKRAATLNEFNPEVKKDVKGKNYTRLTKDSEYKEDSESESVTNHDVKSLLKDKNDTELTEDLDKNDSGSESVTECFFENLLKEKNDTELKKDLEYKNDSESERGVGGITCLDSINGSNKTVESQSAVLGKRKRRTDADATSKIIPWELHMRIQNTLKFRAKVMQYKLEAKKTGKNFLDVSLKQCEDDIRSMAKKFKKLKQLPPDWEYDPATASTYVAAEDDDIPALPTRLPLREQLLACCSRVIDPNKKLPKTKHVALDEEEKKTWADFKEFDKDKPGHHIFFDFDTVHEQCIPLALDNPIVSLTSKFAVTAFNEAIEMYIKKGDKNNIYDIDIVECKYLKMNRSCYFFYITIEAFEDRKCGVYDAKVKLNWDDGSKSLMLFVLTDRKPNVLKEMKTIKLRTHPDKWEDGSCIWYSGMMRRKDRRSICRGYDYRTPWEPDGP